MAKAKLFEEFPGISSADWRSKVEDDLKGADFNKKLVWRTEEGFEVLPYYRMDDLEKLHPDILKNADAMLVSGKKEGNDWKIRQNFDSGLSPEECNCLLKGAVSKGVQALGIDLKNFQGADKALIRQLFDGIDLEKTDVYFSNSPDAENLLDALIAFVNEEKLKPENIHGSLGIDPLGSLASSGIENNKEWDKLPGILKKCQASLPNFKAITIDAGIFQDGGSSLSQELGYGLSMATSYMEHMEAAGISPDETMKVISFYMVTGPNYFMEIAKLRAARWLWNSLAIAWGIKEAVPMHLQTRTAIWNLSLYDPNVNMLRTSTEAMSASLGGGDVITVHPFDILYQEENNFSSRIARNIQIILKEEAYFDKVSDPAAGSYYIEHLTDSIAKQAWAHFLEVEDKGGFKEAFLNGFILEEVLKSAEEKRARAASRRDSILGVNQYPNFSEIIWKELKDIEVKREGMKSSDKAITPFRAAAEIETLRLQTEKKGKRPRVLLLKYGDPVWRTARALFAGNFFACAGYEIIDKTGFETIEEGLSALADEQFDLIVLCSKDESYLDASEKARASSVKATWVIAGYPADQIEQIREAGISHFIHVRSNLFEELKSFHQLLGIV